MKNVESFGIVPIYKDTDGYYVAIVKHSIAGHWGLPKGGPEEGEEPLDTAKRELKEETGLVPVEIKDITVQEKYAFDQDGFSYDKTTTYYIGIVDTMKTETPHPDIDEVKWVKIEEAKNFLTHQSSIDIVEAVIQYLNNL